jgi:branched-chain amino acid aminotransferase/4-amino-4-deoxychorismate lyase
VDSVPIDDRGLLLGDGLFETILADAGRFEAFEAHVDRLVRGCAVLGLPPPPPGRLLTAAEAALCGAGLEQARAAVRLTWTAGSGGRGLERPPQPRPRLLAQAAPASAPAGPARLATVPIRRNQHSPLSRLKTLSYLDNVMARRAASTAGADEALMLNTAGELAGGAAANLFWTSGGRLFTPALDCGVLDGTKRAQVLATAAELGVEAIETRSGPEALAAADGAFLTNSLIGLRAVAAVDGRPLGADALTRRLAQVVQGVVFCGITVVCRGDR